MPVICILLKDGALRPPIPCMEEWRLLAESHPLEVTEKGRYNHSNAHGAQSLFHLIFKINEIIILSFIFFLAKSVQY